MPGHQVCVCPECVSMLVKAYVTVSILLQPGFWVHSGPSRAYLTVSHLLQLDCESMLVKAYMTFSILPQLSFESGQV